MTCSLPPDGWVCTRDAGHEGPCAALPTSSLESYLRQEIAEGKIDFTFRASLTDEGVVIYIHPQGRDGATTPSLRVRGNTLSLSPTSWALGWGPYPDWML